MVDHQKTVIKQSLRAFVFLSVTLPSGWVAHADEKHPIDGPAWPVVKIAPRKGFETELAYRKAISNQAEQLTNRAEQTENTNTKIDLLLAAANLVLAHELEANCVAELIGLYADNKRGETLAEEHGGVEAARDVFRRVEDLLNQAEELIEKLATSNEQDRRGHARFEHRLEALRAFEQALRVYLEARTSVDKAPDARRVASRLSFLLEDRDREVAASARLWQAALRSRGENPSSALSILSLAVSEPPRGAMRTGFFARLLRCRLLAERGQHAGALALILQMEERCHDWFPDERERNQAIRTAAYLQLTFLRDWHDQLDEAKQTRERRWCEERIRVLSAEQFGENKRTLMRLSPVVPILAPVPDPSVNPNNVFKKALSEPRP